MCVVGIAGFGVKTVLSGAAVNHSGNQSFAEFFQCVLFKVQVWCCLYFLHVLPVYHLTDMFHFVVFYQGSLDVFW